MEWICLSPIIFLAGWLAVLLLLDWATSRRNRRNWAKDFWAGYLAALPERSKPPKERALPPPNASPGYAAGFWMGSSSPNDVILDNFGISAASIQEAINRKEDNDATQID